MTKINKGDYLKMGNIIIRLIEINTSGKKEKLTTSVYEDTLNKKKEN